VEVARREVEEYDNSKLKTGKVGMIFFWKN
jgi:hypothetical protein